MYGYVIVLFVPSPASFQVTTSFIYNEVYPLNVVH